ncbi:MAG TPA: hypothetical protein VGN95_15955 [Pyrinomonadaceae bacterium]|nr:hypothetical protein [Pyrinomonadaceae bacterium]
MRLLVILGIFAFITLLLYLRLRPFIRMARQMFGVARGVRQVMRNGPAAPPSQTGGAGEKLVRCAACETWIPAGRAIKLRSSNASYCSHTCLEHAAEGSQRKAAS